MKKDIRLLSLDELKEAITLLGEKAFRAKQVYEWLWKKACTDFNLMTNLSISFRDILKEHFEINEIKFDKNQVSRDGTVKYRFMLQDGHKIESVLIPVDKDNRYTVCVSSQVGCSLACKFCATGQMERMRNLDPGEIYDQVTMVSAHCEELYGHGITNIVYMGMGEPLLNYKNTLQSIRLITSKEGLAMSPRRITISTVGIAKMIHKLCEEDIKVNLALSLHAADDEKRSEIMPINHQNDLKSLMVALKEFFEKTNNRISYEYIAFRDFNDSIKDAEKLVKLCSSFPVRVNIIEYNPVQNVTYTKATEDQINKFALHLTKKGIICTVRRSRGKDIDAACGQLANKDN